jgi:hypothetical protein
MGGGSAIVVVVRRLDPDRQSSADVRAIECKATDLSTRVAVGSSGIAKTCRLEGIAVHDDRAAFAVPASDTIVLTISHPVALATLN